MRAAFGHPPHAVAKRRVLVGFLRNPICTAGTRSSTVAGLSTRNYRRAVESVPEGYRVYHGGQRFAGSSGGPRTGSQMAVSGGDGWIESAARGCGACFLGNKWKCGAKSTSGGMCGSTCQKVYDRRMRNAYAMNNYTEAKAALEKIFRQLERMNPMAARSLEEGLIGPLDVRALGWRRPRCCGFRAKLAGRENP